MSNEKMSNTITVFVNLALTAIDIGILTIVIKLYTEYFKDKSAANRTSGEGL